MKNLFRTVFLIALLLPLTHNAFSQQADSPQSVRHFAGNISLTNNGISIIPTFTLGKPALLFDLSIGGSKLRFDPMLRFGADGKPWSHAAVDCQQNHSERYSQQQRFFMERQFSICLR